MSTETLACLTAEFVEKILKNSENDGSIEVTEIKTEPAIGKGENYGSQIVRASVKYSHDKSDLRVMETISLIVKIQPKIEAPGEEMIVKFETFEMEIDMMQKTLPQMKAILNEDDYRLSPRLFYAEIGDPSFIMMEDLTPLGYRMADKKIGLDLEHCLLAMRNLAKFHATSVALCERGTKLSDMYKKGVYHADHVDEWKQMCILVLKSLSKEVLNWSELGSEKHSYSDKILKLSEVCYDKAMECVDQKSQEFNVLNHGDYWNNNMLFRYDNEGRVIDHIFIDFQLPFWNSPAIDILHFFNTSRSEDVEVHHRETVLMEYLTSLSKTMSQLDCKTKPPTMEALDKALEAYAFYGMMTSFLGLPLVLLDKSENATFNDVALSDIRAYRRKMLRRLAAWNARGLIDI